MRNCMDISKMSMFHHPHYRLQQTTENEEKTPARRLPNAAFDIGPD